MRNYISVILKKSKESSFDKTRNSSHRRALFFVSIPLLLYVFGCGISTKKVAQEKSTSTEETLSILRDPMFQAGIVTYGDTGRGKFKGETLFPFGKEEENPSWNAAEWFSKYKLTDQDFRTDGSIKIYQNQGKFLSFDKRDEEVTVKMEVYGSEEFEHPRKPGEAWPHLLLEQDFEQKPALADESPFVFTFEGRSLFTDLRMPDADLDEALHTAHFQLFFSISNQNESSAGYRDYLWFGLSFYDYRYEEIPLYAAQDLGKEDATQKFIYELGTREYQDYSNLKEDWLELKMNLKPHMLKAFQEAKKNGFLKESELEDMRIVNFNIGWEVTGTFDAGYEFKNLDFRIVNKK